MTRVIRNMVRVSALSPCLSQPASVRAVSTATPILACPGTLPRVKVSCVGAFEIGLVRQPGWLPNKSRKTLCVLFFLSGSCSGTSVSEQLY